MSELKNILLFEQTPEALEAVQNGDAIVSKGGIRRKGNNGSGFLELAKPAVMSVADFQSLFENKEHAEITDERLLNLDSRLELSEEGLETIKNVAWLNNTIVQHTYTLTYEGFKQTLRGIDLLTEQASKLEQYVRVRDQKERIEKAQTYINYLRSDAGNLRSEKYSATNGNIAEHLDQISAFMSMLLNEVESNDGDTFLCVEILCNIIQPFAYVSRRYTAAYYYENDGDLMPGNYNEWIKTISNIYKSVAFRDRLTYYVNLKTSIPFRDKVLVSKGAIRSINDALSGITADEQYIKTHSEKEYRCLNNQIRQKIVSKDYYIQGANVILFLPNDIN